MSSSTTSNRRAGRSSVLPSKILNSIAISCKSLFQNLFAPRINPGSPRFTVCGISVNEDDVKHAMRHLAKRVKRSEKELKRSSENISLHSADNMTFEHDGATLTTSSDSTIARITKHQRNMTRLRGSRDQWRRIAEMQTTRAEEQEAEVAEQTFEGKAQPPTPKPNDSISLIRFISRV